MKKLSLEQRQTRDRAVNSITENIGDYNQLVADVVEEPATGPENVEKLRGYLDAIQTGIDALSDWLDTTTSIMEEFFGEQSAKWQSSTTGEAYDGWLQQYLDFSLEELEEAVADARRELLRADKEGVFHDLEEIDDGIVDFDELEDAP
jgi:hypothetical protein